MTSRGAEATADADVDHSDDAAHRDAVDTAHSLRAPSWAPYRRAADRVGGLHHQPPAPRRRRPAARPHAHHAAAGVALILWVRLLA